MQTEIAPRWAAGRVARCRRSPAATAAATTLPWPAVRPQARRQPWLPTQLPGRRRVAAASLSSSGSPGTDASVGRPDQQPAAPAAASAAAVDIAIEPGPGNSRCIWAGVDVAAPATAVWSALTGYEALGAFIPGLAENRCLERYADGCKLLQVGRQDLALGLRFCARVCLRITEHPRSTPRHLLTLGPGSSRVSGSGGNSSGWSSGSSARGPWWPLGSLSSNGGSGWGSGWGSQQSGASSGSDDEAARFSEAGYLRPRSPLGSAGACHDIAFDLIEGDFAAFKGLWRMQPAGPAGQACRLSYTLFVRPQPWLPVSLVEQRISGEICGNLAAVKAHVEACQRLLP